MITGFLGSFCQRLKFSGFLQLNPNDLNAINLSWTNRLLSDCCATVLKILGGSTVKSAYLRPSFSRNHCYKLPRLNISFSTIGTSTTFVAKTQVPNKPDSFGFATLYLVIDKVFDASDVVDGFFVVRDRIRGIGSISASKVFLPSTHLDHSPVSDLVLFLRKIPDLFVVLVKNQWTFA